MRLSDMVKNGKFVVTCEIDPPKGVNIQEFLNKVDLIKGCVDAVNIGDNQRAVMRAAAMAICHILKSREIEPIMELGTRDRNRIAIQSDLLGAAILGIENLLLVTGHDPSAGDHVEAKSVHDLDSLSLIEIARSLTRGKDMAGHELNGSPDFCFGIIAEPGLETPEHLMPELEKKIARGAQFIQTQAIYEPEVLERFMQSVRKFNIPVLVGHVMLKSASMASFMNSNIPGVHVPDKLIEELEGVSRAQLVDKSLQISIALLKKMKPMCQGIHFMPAGWEMHVPTIVKAVVD